MRRRIPAAALIVASLWTVAVARGEDQPPMLPDLQEIVDRDALRVAVLKHDLPPMIRIDEAGRPLGFDIQLVNEIARALGVKAEFLASADSQDDVIRMVSRKEADIGVSYLSRSVHAGQYVHFTRPYLVQTVTLLVNRQRALHGGKYCPGGRDLVRLFQTQDQIGVLRFSLYQRFVERVVESAKPRMFAGFAEMVTAAESGDIAASLQGEVAAKYFLSRNPQAAIRLKVCNVGTSKDRIAIAVRPDAPDLLGWLNLFISNREIVVDAETVIYQEDVPTF